MKNLTKEEFEIYCLLFAAAADFNITKSELIEIGAEVDRDTFIRVYNHFEADSDMERTATLMDNKKRFAYNDTERQSLIDEMKNIFFLDGKFDAVEKSVFTCLKKLL